MGARVGGWQSDGPTKLPLVLLVPDIRTLKQRHDQPLGLHEYHLGRSDLCLHECAALRRQSIRAEGIGRVEAAYFVLG